MQAAAGHQVLALAVRGSQFPPGVAAAGLDIEPYSIEPLPMGAAVSKAGPAEERLAHERKVFERVAAHLRASSGEIDVIHNHSYEHAALIGLNELHIPLLHTLHLPPDYPWINQALAEIEAGSHVRYTTVSRAMAAAYRRKVGKEPQVVPNWIDCSQVRFGENPGGHALWVGRISAEKGLHTAIRVTRRQGIKLIAIGRPYDEDYFRETIVPELGHPLLDYRGPLPRAAVLEEMARARCLLAPVEWEEAFGLVFVEALAAGTPVVALRRGALPEIVEHGRCGFLAESEDELCNYLLRIEQIDRRECRKFVQSRFSPEQSLQKYEALYTQCIAGRSEQTQQ